MKRVNTTWSSESATRLHKGHSASSPTLMESHTWKKANTQSTNPPGT